MADPDATPSILPPIPPEHRRAAAAQFEQANQAVAGGNHHTGIRLFLSCCLLDPTNLLYRQALRRTEKAKYRNNLRGGWFSWLTAWPARNRQRQARKCRDHWQVLEQGEQVLLRNPWEVGAQMDMAEAAEALGLVDLAVWLLEQARQKKPRDVSANRKLAHLYERRGNFTQARALWELIAKDRPDDPEAAQKCQELTAPTPPEEASLRPEGAQESSPGQRPGNEGQRPGNEGQRPGNEGQPPGNEGQPPGDEGQPPGDEGQPPGDEGQRPEDAAQPPDDAGQPHVSEAPAVEPGPDAGEALRSRIEADPTNAAPYLELARLYRREGRLEEAHSVLRRGLGPTGNAFLLASELADLEIEPFRQDLRIAEARAREAPEDGLAAELRDRLRREVNARELELYRQKADRYPTDLSCRLELGRRLLQAGRVDEAVAQLQAAGEDPASRPQAQELLNACARRRNHQARVRLS
jgi:tetratricopeptide (TPR) repeat protein